MVIIEMVVMVTIGVVIIIEIVMMMVVMKNDDDDTLKPGGGTIVHPKARIEARAGPIIIGFALLIIGNIINKMTL